MEQDQPASLFGLSIDPTSKTHLWETARWARFLAICGFIMIGLMIIYGIIFSFVFSNIMSKGNPYSPYNSNSFSNALGIGMFIFYLVCAVIAFFPYYFLLRFANKMKLALTSTDQSVLNDSFMNLKILYRYMGILMIIGLVLFAFAIISMLMTAVMF